MDGGSWQLCRVLFMRNACPEHSLGSDPYPVKG